MIRKSKNIGLLLVFALVINSCIQQIDIAEFPDQQKLVIEANFTDELKVQEVRLFFTGSVAGGEQPPLSGAIVQIEDDNGLVIPFVESSPGMYSSSFEVRGEQGRSYKLSFETTGGERFSTDFQKMPKKIAVQSIQSQSVELAPEQESGLALSSGLLFTVNAEGLSDEDVFTRMQWRDALRTVVPYPSKFTGNVRIPEIEERPSPMDTCYLTDISTEVLLSNSVGNPDAVINGFGLNAIRFSQLLYADRYLIEVKINSISRDAYDYYEGLQNLTDGAGTLFDIQQGEVFGNVRSESTNGEFTLGFFEVASVTVSTEIFDLPQLRSENNEQDGFDVLCPSTAFYQWSDGPLMDFFEGVDVGGDFFEVNQRAPYRVYDYDSLPPPWGTAFLRFAQCTDCIFFGSRSRPIYWPE